MTELAAAPPKSGLMKQLLKNRLSLIGTILILLLTIVAITADFLASNKPVLIYSENGLFLPSTTNYPVWLRIEDNLYFPIMELIPVIGHSNFYPEIIDQSMIKRTDISEIYNTWGGQSIIRLNPLLPFSYYQTDYSNTRSEPTRKHLLGTDHLGRDILTRIIHGSRISLQVGLLSQIIALSIGIVLGTLSGYYRGWLDMLLMRITDIFFAFPFLLFVMAIVSVFPPSITIVFIAMGFVSWPGYARIIRAQVLSLREKEFIEAIRSLGASDFRILLKHILPNTMAPIIVQVSLGMAGAVLAEAGLSYLGLGAQPPTPSWGLMIAQTQSEISPFWWMSIFPGIAIMMAVYGFNLLGDGLRDILDPRLK